MTSPHDYRFGRIYGIGGTRSHPPPTVLDDTTVNAVVDNHPNLDSYPEDNVNNPEIHNATGQQPMGTRPGDYDNLIDLNSQEWPLDIPIYSSYYNNKSESQGGRRPIDDYLS